MSKIDGGHAFPFNCVRIASDGATIEDSFVNGMSLRDYFAAKQLVAYRAHPANESTASMAGVAKYCYEMADAMLAARGDV